MKKIIIILALFCSFAATAQYTPPPGYTNINSSYDWLAGVFRALGLPAGGNAAFTTGQAHRAGAVYYDSTGADAGLKVWNGSAWTGVGEVTQSALEDSLDRKIDSIGRRSGVDSIDVYKNGVLVFSVKDSTGGSAINNSNAGAFYRWLKPDAQEIKSFANGYGILLDSTTNTDAITAALDSATVFPQIRASIPDPNLIIQSAGAGEPTWFASGDTLYMKKIKNTAFISASTDTDSSLLNSLSATGTPDNTNFLRGDNTWAVPSGGALTSTQVGVGNGSNILSGSSNLTWDGGTLSLIPSSNNQNTIAVKTSVGGMAVQLGTMPTLPAYGGIWLGSVTPSTTNYFAVSNTSEALINHSTAQKFRIANVDAMMISSSKEILIGSTTDQGSYNLQVTGASIFNPGVVLKAGTTALAPLKFTTTGAALTTATTAGQMEVLVDSIYYTGSGSVRKRLAYADEIISTTPTLTRNLNLESITASENKGIFYTPVAITITEVRAVSVGITPSVTYNIAFGSDRTSGTNVFTAGQTTTSTTTGDVASGVNDNTIPAGSYIWLTTSAAATPPTEILFTITYTED